jgi:hypothetical protein
MANDPASRPTATQLREELSGVHRDPDPTMIMRPVQPFPPTQRQPGNDDPTQPSLNTGDTSRSMDTPTLFRPQLPGWPPPSAPLT